QWVEEEPAETLPSAGRLDIRQEPGLRVTAVVGQRRSDLVVQCHHVACDGAGAMDFAGDLLTAYANALDGSEPFRFKPLEFERLRRRASFGLSWRDLGRLAPQQLAGLRRLVQFYRLKKPLVVVP